LFITGCSYKKNVFDSNYFCKKLDLSCIKKNQKVVFKTSKGNLVVRLYGEKKPVTVSNFIQNVENNIYNNKRFYKIIEFPQVKLIHSGIYQGNISYKKENQNLKKTRRNIPLEIKLKKEIEPKYNFQIVDPSEIINLANFFENGSLAMVKSGEKNSSSTEFFFVTNKFPELDGRYSIFGKVVKGIEILQKIDKKDFIYKVIISN
tara:strand:+ start:471 stop:1082 length:612 start_codon:yes stop_codon:yes gene_type:complete